MININIINHIETNYYFRVPPPFSLTPRGRVMAGDIRNFNTEELIDCLQDLPGRVHTILRKNKINGRSFLLLTDEELLRFDMEESDRIQVLQRIHEMIRELEPEVSGCIHVIFITLLVYLRLSKKSQKRKHI